MDAPGWPEDWDQRLAGVGCPLCGAHGTDDNGYGVRVLAGEYADAYLQRAPPTPGYAIAIWTGRHVSEPSDLTPAELAGFVADTVVVGAAIAAVYAPAKVNYLTLGNSVPHLHTHIIARYLGDPYPGRPLPWSVVEAAAPLPEAEFAAQVAALRRALE